MAINSIDNLIDALPGQRIYYFKTALTSVAGVLCSSWTQPGIPGAGSTPPSGAGEVPTKSTSGALIFTNPTGGNLSYLVNLAFAGNNTQNLILCDRLVHTSGLSGTSTSAQTVNSSSVNRPDSTGEGASIFLEVYTATGSIATTVTASYTNQAGTSGRTTPSVTYPASMAARYSVQLPLQAGDTGVRSVQSVTLAASTLTAGNFGVTIARPILTIPNTGGLAGSAIDLFTAGMPTIPDNACLFFYSVPVATTAFNGSGIITLAQG